jgi:hypothetical protein
MSEISDFTKLVLDRMETNPDEFVHIGGNYTRWQGLVQGLEELARGDTEGRYIKVLWPLTDEERGLLLEKYRKIYLAELHKDMLKNIVSGNDKQYGKTLGSNDINPVKDSTYVGRGAHPNRLVTTAGMQDAALNLLNKEFADSFATTAVKMEGAQVPMSNTGAVKSKFTLTQSQHIIAKQMGISPYEYAQRLAKYEALDND